MNNIKKQLEIQKEHNSRLADQIRKCNKEVIRLRELLQKKNSLRKEVLLKETIKKYIKKNMTT